MGYEDDDESYSFVNDNQDGEDDDDENSEEEEEEEDTGRHINRGDHDNEGWNERMPQPRLPPPPLKRHRRPTVSDGGGMNEGKERTSENQRSNERIIPLKPDELYVDWGSILRSSATTPAWWVHQPFVNHNLPLIEIDKLIGHSTHLTTYHHPCTSTRQGRTFHNPLLGLPNIPLRPTLLQQLIFDPATKLTAAYLQQQHRHNYYHIVNDTITNDTPNTDDNNPRPPKQARRGTKSSAGHHHSVYYERFHHSAAMAIAMFLEEMMTATLLPVAQQYVHYCRRHYPEPDEEQDGRIWTLPPEEAILRLYHDANHWSSSSSHTSSSNDHTDGSVSASPSTTLLSTRIATRSRVPGAMGTSLLNQPHERSDRARIAHDNWCRTTATTTHHSRPPWLEWMKRDASFYQLLIDNIPPPAVTAATRAAEATLVTNDVVVDQMANEI